MTGWPALDCRAERPTVETCRLVLQLIAMLPRLDSWINRGWDVALRVAPSGFATYATPGGGGRAFIAEFDVREECLRITCHPAPSFRLNMSARARSSKCKPA